MTKQLKIQDLIPFMKDGWVAMDKSGEWCWFDKKPIMEEEVLEWIPDYDGLYYRINKVFDIAPVSDWTKSLIKVENNNAR